MKELSYEVICERTRNFIKHIFDTYENPQALTKMLESVFEMKGIYCGFQEKNTSEKLMSCIYPQMI
jgi:hypothetical protein